VLFACRAELGRGTEGEPIRSCASAVGRPPPVGWVFDGRGLGGMFVRSPFIQTPPSIGSAAELLAEPSEGVTK
jgi:hypothetical protein